MPQIIQRTGKALKCIGVSQSGKPCDKPGKHYVTQGLVGRIRMICDDHYAERYGQTALYIRQYTRGFI